MLSLCWYCQRLVALIPEACSRVCRCAGSTAWVAGEHAGSIARDTRSQELKGDVVCAGGARRDGLA
jgi:hypothetical protein